MTLYIYKKAEDSTNTNSADNASRSEGEIKSEQYTASNTPASNATIGGMIGAIIGGLGGYTWGASDLDHLSEEQKFRRRLKNALLYGAVGAVGGAGLGYGGTVLKGELDKKRERNFSERAIDWYVDAPLGYGAGIAGLGGAVIGGASGYLAHPRDLVGTTRRGSTFRGGARGFINGVLAGGTVDVIKEVTKKFIKD